MEGFLLLQWAGAWLGPEGRAGKKGACGGPALEAEGRDITTRGAGLAAPESGARFDKPQCFGR